MKIKTFNLNKWFLLVLTVKTNIRVLGVSEADKTLFLDKNTRTLNLADIEGWKVTETEGLKVADTDSVENGWKVADTNISLN